MLAYLISRKHVPTKRYYVFWNWIDAEGEFFDTAHFSDSLQKYPVEVVICYWARSKWITTSYYYHK
jgi:hypothetical protein